ncbi:MAG: UDP-N-acetylmuramoyl-tripeptide--D-alanyl-D-alanine ligase [Bacteroidetes bacterium]|nr:UDP-N-acetylmuramoyl-tripeptide--D-alanyl-D-alanine ligase [Bacteroidota bacterium]
MTTPENLYSLFLRHPEISTDSRQIKEGSIFFALKGDTFDGNAYAGLALEKGASFSVVDDARYCIDQRFILVENALASLQQLAKFHRNRFQIPVLAITGTNGKTTTKELIQAVLSKKHETLATSGNLNNHIGVPLTLLKIKAGTEIAVVEMGANHPGEIDFLCTIAEPTHGIITNIGKAHLEGFGGFEGVVSTKTELYRFLKSRHGIAFVNQSNPLLVKNSEGMNVVSYENGTIFGPDEKDLTQDPFLKMKIILEQQEISLSTNLFGNYNAENILAAVSIGHFFGVDPILMKDAIESYEPQNNRSQVLKTPNNLLILDMYNANPTSMELALTNFAGSPAVRKVLILGDMLELGNETDPEHQVVLERIEKLGFSEVYLIGPAFTRLNTKREWLCFQDSELAAMWLSHHKLTEAEILLKGSRGIKLEKIVDLL